MKRAFVLLSMLLFLGGASGAADSRSEFTSGESWVKRMSTREKYMSLIPPAIVFSDYDVHLKLNLPRYIFLIDRIMERNPRLADEEIANIFASTIYLFEPENRHALKTMEVNFLQGDFESKPLGRPRLTVEELLKEASGSKN